MRGKLIVILLYTLLSLSCQSSKQSKYQDLAAQFLKKVEQNDFAAARKMIKANLVEIAKNEEMFGDDMAKIKALMEKNGFPKTLKVQEKSSTLLAASVEIDLGKPNNPMIDKYQLHLDFMNYAPDRIYGYRLEPILGF